MTGAGLDVRVERDGTRVRITGDLDVAGVDLVRARACAAERRAGPRLLVDLTGLRFIDSSGLGLLVAMDRGRRAHGRRLRVLVVEAGAVAKVLGYSGLDQVFDVRVTAS
ncbi:STAS domain-containing protein [Nocardiopsis baichengensis]|uniref:STAS domain-containing protein n=1 Tax=Nocardiopsis baichengensis TaxID=280240 RepID=UPI00034C0302|nr:STAS domain-containing protein [Nocardiopsis baichengensis]